MAFLLGPEPPRRRRRSSMLGYGSPRRRRRHVRRRRRGFWSGFAHATHTDHLRHRVGGAVGRRALEWRNRSRRRKGKPPIPHRGNWFGPFPSARRPVRSSSRPRGSSSSRKSAPAFDGGRAVKATNTPRKAPLFGTSTSSSGLAGPGNRGAGAGMGVPAYGTGGAHGDGDHMLSPGSAGGSATGGAPVPAGGIYHGRHGGEGHIAGRTKAPRESYYVDPQTGETKRNWPDKPVKPFSTGGNLMSEPSTAPAVGEMPETDADHMSWTNDFSTQLNDMAEELREKAEALVSEINMTDEIMGGLNDAADSLSQAAEGIGAHAAAYEEHYGDIRDVMQNSDGKVPGFDPNSRYWSEVS